MKSLLQILLALLALRFLFCLIKMAVTGRRIGKSGSNQERTMATWSHREALSSMKRTMAWIVGVVVILDFSAKVFEHMTTLLAIHLAFCVAPFIVFFYLSAYRYPGDAYAPTHRRIVYPTIFFGVATIATGLLAKFL